MALKKFCRKSGCKSLVEGGYCEEHKDLDKQYEQQRGSAAERGYDSKWKVARARFLRSHPLCVHCELSSLVTAATVVDHIIPHKGDMRLFWNVSNWQGLCASCHSIKTVKEDGGFGNVPRAVK
ncbi:HNH endonuclease [Paenibacillus sp. FSL H3-0310]|uniref:HNH endonuclease n=1 Tax=Paenibacillus sp. FSL H3-0310 TaxID=2921429 RepID=UPI0030FA5084